jgi:4-alpha-glucanotransferase
MLEISGLKMRRWVRNSACVVSDQIGETEKFEDFGRIPHLASLTRTTADPSVRGYRERLGYASEYQMQFPRASGILLHPTSLPGEFGIGDLGPNAYAFVDVLAEAKQKYWQILPLGPTGYGDSPYGSFSAFAGNTLLISPEKLVEEGLIDAATLTAKPKFPKNKVDFGAAYEWKNQILPLAAKAFDASTSEAFAAFSRENGWWLDDYAAFRAIKADQGQRPWYEWPDGIKLRDPEALTEAAKRLTEQVAVEKVAQFLFYSQWAKLKTYANDKGVYIIGDIPIFVALDSADVWCNRPKFKLTDDGSPTVVAGVPPDYFSKTGQLWGNPLYDWDALRADGFSWWLARVSAAMRQVDVIRIDHFRGFAAAWEVPGGDPTAERGVWAEAPGGELFTAFRRALGDVPMIAEDLGVITPDVDRLRDAFGLPGMRILQYAFGGDARNLHLPHNYVRNCVSYTGTHDNETTAGWWKGLPKAATGPRGHLKRYLSTTAKEPHWDLIRAAWSSVADTAIAPLQDVLGLGNEARMNIPASTGGNWNWRFADGDITPKTIDRLRELTELYGRDS